MVPPGESQEDFYFLECMARGPEAAGSGGGGQLWSEGSAGSLDLLSGLVVKPKLLDELCTNN